MAAQTAFAWAFTWEYSMVTNPFLFDAASDATAQWKGAADVVADHVILNADV